MDSAVMCDKALLSTGFQQWSANAANEWPALLASFKATAPDDFDLFFAMNRLDVRPVAKRGALRCYKSMPPTPP